MKSPFRFTASLAIVAVLGLIAGTVASTQAAIVLGLIALVPLTLAAHYSLPPDPRAPIGQPGWHDVLVRFHSIDPAGAVRVMDRLGLEIWTDTGAATAHDQLGWLTVHMAVPACSDDRAAQWARRILKSGPFVGLVEIDSITVLPDLLPPQPQDRLVSALA